jgi:hypothetical protein
MDGFLAYVGRVLRQGRYKLPIFWGIPLPVIWLVSGPVRAIVLVGGCALIAFPLGYLAHRRRGGRG